jgi:hypothetical protein
MEPIITEFIDNIMEYENTTGHPDRQAEHIDQGISLVAPNVAGGNFDVIAEHGFPPVFEP